MAVLSASLKHCRDDDCRDDDCIVFWDVDSLNENVVAILFVDFSELDLVLKTLLLTDFGEVDSMLTAGDVEITDFFRLDLELVLWSFLMKVGRLDELVSGYFKLFQKNALRDEFSLITLSFSLKIMQK